MRGVGISWTIFKSEIYTKWGTALAETCVSDAPIKAISNTVESSFLIMVCQLSDRVKHIVIVAI